MPIINITKNKHIKEYNKHIKDTKIVDNICSYLMNICSERYFKLCNSIIVKKTTKSYLNVEYIKYLYLLQKASDQIISKKLNFYDENKCIRENDILINMFIILYNNSNIDYNKKVESEIYNLYQHYVY